MRFRLRRVEPVPDIFAAVMATGILSVSALDHRQRWISIGLAAAAVLALVVMIALVTAKIIARHRFPFDLRNPDVTVRLFTFVAACAVLCARFPGVPGAAGILAAAAWAGWVVLAFWAVRSMLPLGWVGLRDRAHGVWELTTVATSGVAIVTAQFALLGHDTELWTIGFVVWLIALGIYGVITWLIVWRARAAPAPEVWRPDSWVLMGGLAIGTLAGDRLHLAGESIISADWLLVAVRVVTVGTWVLATLWIPLLVYITGRHLEPRFSGAWWATVFPLGMYSAATYAMLMETGWQLFRWVSLVFFWIALATWVLTVAAAGVALVRPGLAPK
jgi:tellurite resistance protein TehA-like permease